jgi:hypothetical protein
MPGNGPTRLNDITIKRLCDALKRGNTRLNACALARVNPSVFQSWVNKAKSGDPDYLEFALKIRDAEAAAEDEAVDLVKWGRSGWQGAAWFLQRRNRKKWGDITKQGAVQVSANDNRLEEIPLEDLEQAIADAAEMRRKALEVIAKKA